MATFAATGVRGVVALAAIAAGVVGLGAGTQNAAPAQASSSSYSLATQTLPNGSRVVARWNPCQTITYRVNATMAGSTDAQRVAAVRDVMAAFDRASAATGIRFRYAGFSSQIPRNSTSRWYDRQTAAEIVVAWVKQTSPNYSSNLLGRSGSGYASGTGGYAYKYWTSGSNPWRGATGRGFVVINAAQNSRFAPGFGSGSTRGALLMHEIGHALGLLHVGSTSQLMYPTVLSRSSTGYASGDRAGLSRLGTAAGCISVPSWVWRDLS